MKHWLSKPRTPRTNGVVERFNSRIANVLKTYRFSSCEDLEQTLLHCVVLYNHQVLQSSPKRKAPIQTMRIWYQTHPHLIHKGPWDWSGWKVALFGFAPRSLGISKIKALLFWPAARLTLGWQRQHCKACCTTAWCSTPPVGYEYDSIAERWFARTDAAPALIGRSDARNQLPALYSALFDLQRSVFLLTQVTLQRP